MLNIYYGREKLDKSKFIFENMEGKSLLIVPDQYTLEAERDAFFYLKKKAILDIDVMSFSRIGEIIVERAGVKPEVIGREGRQMLLTKILREKANELEVFKGSANKSEFVDMIHDLISDFKQHNTTVETLQEAISKIEKDGILKRKLQEVQTVYEAYEKYTEGKYLDNEDYISYYVSLMRESGFIEGKTIWVYGFDSFTDRNMTVIKEMSACAKEVNIILTYDDNISSEEDFFNIGKLMMERFKRTVGAENISTMQISEEYNCETKKEILLNKSNNLYNEAVNAAVYVLSLVRDRGYRFKDIALISNDMENCGGMYKRVFAEYGMDLFIDSKRSIMHHPAINYILALMGIAKYNFQREDVIKLAKTGFVCDNDDDVEFIEIYANIFNVRGAAWKKEFTKGVYRYTAEEMERLNAIRKQIIDPIIRFNEDFKEAKFVSDKVKCLLDFLEKTVSMEERVEKLSEKQEVNGQLEMAQESAQIWETVKGILEQMVNILGDEKMSKKEFVEILSSGFEAVEIGLLPPGVDGLIMGTMQRTRRSHIKASVIVGATEELLPSQNVDVGILNEDERIFLSDNNISICKLSQLKSMEESMAIYRNLEKASDLIYMSYSGSDSEGKISMPSMVFTKLAEENPEIKIGKDGFGGDEFESLIGGLEATKNNLIGALMKVVEEGAVDERWLEVYKYFEDKSEVDEIVEALMQKNIQLPISFEQANSLYKYDENADFKLSPSRLEKFGNCPFAHFVSYGLKPEENREYIIGAPEAGNVYHECLMIVSQEITGSLKPGEKITDENSLWMTITKEEADEKVRKTLEGISEEYMEGIMSQGEYEKYKAQRIEKVCSDSVWMAIEQIRAGSIESMNFEVEFGKGKMLPPIAMDLENGRARLEGKIDRWDVLSGDFSKVIDYKSGNDSFNEKEAKAGMKLQLFVYLLATLGRELKPGGAFYFHLDEALEKEKMTSQFKLNGFLVDDPQMVASLDKDGGGRSSDVFTKGKNIFSQGDFDKLLADVSEKIKEMSNDLTKGAIDILPVMSKNKTGCDYCPYKGICKFDISIEGCKYNMV